MDYWATCYRHCVVAVSIVVVVAAAVSAWLLSRRRLIGIMHKNG